MSEGTETSSSRRLRQMTVTTTGEQLYEDVKDVERISCGGRRRDIKIELEGRKSNSSIIMSLK